MRASAPLGAVSHERRLIFRNPNDASETESRRRRVFAVRASGGARSLSVGAAFGGGYFSSSTTSGAVDMEPLLPTALSV